MDLMMEEAKSLEYSDCQKYVPVDTNRRGPSGLAERRPAAISSSSFRQAIEAIAGRSEASPLVASNCGLRLLTVSSIGTLL
jgi:hypothetical protein